MRTSNCNGQLGIDVDQPCIFVLEIVWHRVSPLQFQPPAALLDRDRHQVLNDRKFCAATSSYQMYYLIVTSNLKRCIYYYRLDF